MPELLNNIDSDLIQTEKDFHIKTPKPQKKGKLVKILIKILTIIFILGMLIVIFTYQVGKDNSSQDKIKDWRYSGQTNSSNYVSNKHNGIKLLNFRDLVYQDVLPSVEYLNYDSILTEYSLFDSGFQICPDMLCLLSSHAYAYDPFIGDSSYYLLTAVKPGARLFEFRPRKKDIVILVDISANMNEKAGDQQTKLQIVKQSLIQLVDEFEHSDRLAIIVFDSESQIAKPLNYIGRTDIVALQAGIDLLSTQNQGQNIQDAYKKATDLLTKNQDQNFSRRDKYVLIISNNQISFDRELLNTIDSKSEQDNIYTSVVLLGDKVPVLLESQIRKIVGSNFLCVNSEQELKQSLIKKWNYFIEPILFSLHLKVDPDLSDSDNYLIDNIDEDGNLSLGSVFAFDVEKKYLPQSMILVKTPNLKKAKYELELSYRDYKDKAYSEKTQLQFNDKQEEYYDNESIKKVVVLATYAKQLQEIIAQIDNSQQSIKLSQNQIIQLKELKNYLDSQQSYIQDQSLSKEVEVVDYLLKQSDQTWKLPHVLVIEKQQSLQCEEDSDCVIKDVGSCCGYYPKCVHVNFQPDPEKVKQECEEQGLVSTCEVPDIKSCQCVAGECMELSE